MPSTFASAVSRLDASVRESLFVFLLSRGLVLLIFIVVGQLEFGAPESGAGPSGPITARNAIISLSHAPIGRRLRETVAQGDVNHYVELSRVGYDARPFGADRHTSSLYAFCPVLPALLWLIGRLGLDVLLAGSLLSNLFFLGALVLFHKLVIALGYDASTATRALFYLAFFPASYFFSLPMTESAFLLLTLASFYAAIKSRWLVSGSIGAIASATRLNGILIGPALAVLWWERDRQRSIWQLISVALTPLGLLVYMFLTWRWSGTALAAAKAAGDRHGGFFLAPLWEYLRDPGTVALPWNFVLLNFLVALLAFAAVYFLIRQRQWSLAVYAATMILLPLSTATLVSLARYMSVCFPIFIALGAVSNSTRKDQIIRVVFISLFVLMTAAFAARFTMALT
jgi:mannosyltransferase PIG-V